MVLYDADAAAVLQAIHHAQTTIFTPDQLLRLPDIVRALSRYTVAGAEELRAEMNERPASQKQARPPKQPDTTILAKLVESSQKLLRRRRD